MTNNFDIQATIKGCLKKRAKEQRALVDHFAGFLYVICKRYLNDDKYAQDLVQDSFIKIFQNLEKYDAKKGQFEAWITTIAIRLCLNKLSKNRLQLVRLPDMPEFDTTDKTSLQALDQLETKYLIDLIKELPNGYREIFNLVIIDGFSHKEIAAMLNISIENSRTRLRRAKVILRKNIERVNKYDQWVNSI